MPGLVISTNDISKEGTYYFKLTINSLAVPPDGLWMEYQFEITLIDNPCVKGFSGLPTKSPVEIEYFLFDQAIDYKFE